MWSLPGADRSRERVDRASRSWSHARRRALSGHKKAADSLAWNSSGTRLASAARDFTVRVWTIDVRRDISTYGECVELRGHSDDVTRVQWHPTANDLLASCSADKSVKVWEVRGGAGKLVTSVSTIGDNLHLKWSPCGRMLLLLNSSNLVSLLAWDATARKLQVLKSVGFSLDVNDIEWEKGSSERVVLGHQNGTLEVLAVPSLAKLHSIPAHGSTVFSLAVDPLGRYLATGAADSLVHLWHAQELVCVRTFSRLDDSIRALSFSGDGTLIAYGGKDPRIEIADVETGARVHIMDVQEETLSIAFHPTAMMMAYSTADKTRAVGDVHLLSIAPVASVPAASSSASSGAKSASSSSGSTAVAKPGSNAPSTKAPVKSEKTDSTSRPASASQSHKKDSGGSAPMKM